MGKVNDQFIIDELKKGNTSVFRYLYADFEKITGFVRKNSGNEEQARDIFHDALMALYENIKNNTFTLNAMLSTYLYSTCRNLWLYQLRKNKPMAMQQIEDSDIQLVDTGEQEMQLSKAQESMVAAIGKALNNMKEPCASILNMFYFKKMHYKQIADTMGYANEKSVKNQKYRCIQQLKDQLPDNYTDTV